MSKHELIVTVNGEERAHYVDARLTLADFLRDYCGLTGTHLGCEHGVCGACTVFVDGRSARSCLLFACQIQPGQAVVTIEGLRSDTSELTIVQQAFKDEFGLQCGFCTPGMVVAVTELLERYPVPTTEEIVDHLSGNLCRCTGYQGIMRAVERASAAMHPAEASS